MIKKVKKGVIGALNPDEIVIILGKKQSLYKVMRLRDCKIFIDVRPQKLKSIC